MSLVRTQAAVSALFGALVVSMAHAEPSTTAWLQDVAVQPQHTTQTVLGFEHHLTDVKARGAGIDFLRARLEAGFLPKASLAPEVVFEQRGEEPLRLQEVAFHARFRALDWQAWPRLMVYGGYANDLGDERDHLLKVGLAGSYDYGGLYLNADLRPTLQLGGEQGKALESWTGVAIGYGWASTWQARVGLESFMIVPWIGERTSDPTFGEAAESNTYYYGPSFAFAVGPFWTSVSAVTGYFISPAASQFLLSWLAGVGY